MKTIAVDLDDTLNNFTETLRGTDFSNEASYGIPDETFHAYMAKLRAGLADDSDLLSTEYTYFRYKIHLQCYERADARADGIEFMQWLRKNHWRIVICTHRDLRRCSDSTKQWLRNNGMPFDHLFMALHKPNFCKTWGIGHLVDDHLFSIAQGRRHGVQVFYPAMEKHTSIEPNGARAFKTFEEVRQWIQG